jgi:hypothetical protein
VAAIEGSAEVPKKFECKLCELGSSQGEIPKLGAPSREVEKSRGARTTIGSRVKGGPLDQNPIAYRAFRGLEVERTSS